MRVRGVCAQFLAWAQQRSAQAGVGEEEFLAATGAAVTHGRLGEGPYRRVVDFLKSLPRADLPVSQDFLSGVMGGLPTLANVCANCRTMDEALRTFEYGQPLLSEFDSVSLRLQSDGVEVHLDETADPHTDDFTALGYFILIVNLIRLYAPAAPMVAEVQVAGHDLAGRNVEMLGQFFGRRPELGARRTTMRVWSNDVRQRYEPYNASLHRFMARQLEQEVGSVSRNVSIADLVLEELRTLIRSGDWEAHTVFVQACEILGMTTVRMRAVLASEQTSSADLLTRARYAHAVDLLSSTTLSMAAISDELRFGTQASFTRFFQSQSGMAPTAFRRRSLLNR